MKRINPGAAPFGGGAPLVVLTDFDATISVIDVGDRMVAELAPLPPDALANGPITPRQFWELSVPRLPARQAELLALIDSVQIDPTFLDFVRYCEAEGIPLAIVSDGWRFYVEPILKRYGLDHLTVYCNEMLPDGTLVWPNGNPICHHCGCCKPLVVKRTKAQGSRVIYIGDGTSDFYAAVYADWIFARATLERHARSQGSPYFSFPHFAFVQETIATNLHAFRDGSMDGKSSVKTEICVFAETDQ